MPEAPDDASGGVVFTTGADARFGYHLVNLLGSVKANSPGVFDRLVAYDLGLDPRQRRLLDDVRGVEVRTVPPFAPHYLAGWTYRAWVWRHLDADVIFWVDAGATVLRSLADALAQVRERGYFVVGQGHPVRPTIPSDYYALYDIPDDLPERETIAGGILGFSTSSEFFERVVVPVYEDNLLGRNLGFSAEEVERRNRGINRQDPVIIRDCPLFRPGQTLLNIHFYESVADPFVNDLDEYAGWRSPRDHPRQVIWGHRRRGNMAYLPRAPASLRGRALGLALRVRWWLRLHRKLFTASSYLWKARKVGRALRRAPA